MTTPLVTAVIPVHNGRAFVREALDSVLTQTHPAIECIVIDDGSTDGTGNVVEEMGSRVRCIRQEQRGVAAARNAGAAAGRGDYFAFLDVDDLWEPEKTRRQLEVMNSSRVPMALCAAQIVDEWLRPLARLGMSAPDRPLLGMVLFDGTTVSCSSTALIERGAFNVLSGFDESLGTSADWDFLARYIVCFERLAYIDQPLIKYRRHGSNMSGDIRATERDMLRCYAKLFASANVPSVVRDEKRRAYSALHHMLAGSYWEAGDRRRAVRNALRSVLWHPERLYHRLVRRSPLRREHSS